jgi:uridylate kinase
MGVRWNRILLKLSGAALAGKVGRGVDFERAGTLAETVKAAAETGVEIALVVGGGNIVRGGEAANAGMDRASADYAGMLATVINALVLQDQMEKLGLETRVQTAIHMEEVAEPFIRRRAVRHLERKRVVILSGGTGNPYFTSDTAAALRAAELGAQAILKATNVDGVYDKDPHEFADALRFDVLDYNEVLDRRLKVMDLTAFTLSMENNIPIIVFNIDVPDCIRRICLGERIGTYVGRLADET